MWDRVVAGFAWAEPARCCWGRLSLLDFCGSLCVVWAFRQARGTRVPRLESLVACTVGQFGGTTLTALMLGQYPSWVAGAHVWPALLAAWVLLLHCPGDLGARIYGDPGAWWLREAVAFGSVVSGAHSVTSWGADKVFAAEHLGVRASVVAAVFAGAMSACGGGVLSELFWGRGRLVATPAVVRAMVASVLYYVLLFGWTGVGGGGLAAAEARAVVFAFVCAVNYLTRVTGTDPLWVVGAAVEVVLPSAGSENSKDD